jgi:hypothetical protein
VMCVRAGGGVLACSACRTPSQIRLHALAVLFELGERASRAARSAIFAS